MDYLGMVGAISEHDGVDISDMFQALGWDRKPFDRAPALMRTADILEAWGWSLVAVPSDSVPDGSIVIGYGDGTPRPEPRPLGDAFAEAWRQHCAGEGGL